MREDGALMGRTKWYRRVGWVIVILYIICQWGDDEYTALNEPMRAAASWRREKEAIT